MPFRTDLSATNAALILVVAVVAVAALGSRTAGVLAALSAAAWFDFFLTRPYQRFAEADRDDVETAVLLLVVGLLVSQLAVRARRLQAVVVTDAAHLSSLQETARLVEDGGSPEVVVEHVRRELVGLLGLRGCHFEYGTLMGNLPRLEHGGGVWLHRPGRVREYADWPDGETELRVVGGGHYYGRFLLDPPGHPCPPRRRAWWLSRRLPRPAPRWTRPECPTGADPVVDGPPVWVALRVLGRPYGARQGDLTPG